MTDTNSNKDMCSQSLLAVYVRAIFIIKSNVQRWNSIESKQRLNGRGVVVSIHLSLFNSIRLCSIIQPKLLRHTFLSDLPDLLVAREQIESRIEDLCNIRSAV